MEPPLLCKLMLSRGGPPFTLCVDEIQGWIPFSMYLKIDDLSGWIHPIVKKGVLPWPEDNFYGPHGSSFIKVTKIDKRTMKYILHCSLLKTPQG